MKKSNALFCIVTLGCLAVTASLQAQVAPTLGSPGGIDLNGGSDFTSSAQTGSASRFLWLPGKAALLFGSVPSTPSPGNIGQYSVAGGFNVKASGAGAVAFGAYSTANGSGSIAIGGFSNDSTSGATAGGGCIALGYYCRAGVQITGTAGSIALGTFSQALNSQAVALSGGLAFGGKSFAMLGEADGTGSIVIGDGAWGQTDNSIAVGGAATTFAKNAVAIGYYAVSRSVGGIAMGGNNVARKKDGTSFPDPVNASPDDPVFEIGTGTTTVSNALTVFRDGTVRLSKASGGISMGQFQ